ncbi:MAG: polysaccharide deacetylase [Verrucomicrobiales bacterium]|nr:polysaccharide deacetylase [Verrucomicrobiales bacterium]
MLRLGPTNPYNRNTVNNPYDPEPRFTWPHDKRCAVMLCLDVDGETTALSEDPKLVDRLTTFSQCQYGPEVGVPRLLGLLNHLGVAATFFIPSYVAEQHPRMTLAIANAGHEIGAHGHLHEKLAELTRKEEEAILIESLAILENLTGKRPMGHRAPWFEINPWTAELLAKHGLHYSASMMRDDVPFLHTNGLVEIPGQWMLEDWEQFAFNPDPQWGVIPEDCDKVYRLWWDEFIAMRDYGCCFTLTLHPWLSGRPSRVKLVERLLTDIQATGDAWLATGSEIADWFQENPSARREMTL